ncbi:MAG TPA: hypothetical protein VLQ93_00985 [Myxococcaceae bacterium]|nr:hypothetical protein [Myxococcaceae bacterium]
MKRLLSSFGLLALLAVIPVSQSHAQQSATIEAADVDLRTKVASGLAEGAAMHGIEVDTQNFVYASRDDGKLVNTGVSWFDTLTSKDLAAGTTLGMAYLSGFGMEPGFYRVDVRIPEGASEGEAYFVTADGKVARVARAAATAGNTAKGKWTGSISWGSVTVDYHSDKISVEVTVSW